MRLTTTEMSITDSDIRTQTFTAVTTTLSYGTWFTRLARTTSIIFVSDIFPTQPHGLFSSTYNLSDDNLFQAEF